MDTLCKRYTMWTGCTTRRTRKSPRTQRRANFGFSFAGRGFFVIGLHPASSRLARRFPWPTLVFNAHFQFDRLKADGRYPEDAESHPGARNGLAGQPEPEPERLWGAV